MSWEAQEASAALLVEVVVPVSAGPCQPQEAQQATEEAVEVVAELAGVLGVAKEAEAEATLEELAQAVGEVLSALSPVLPGQLSVSIRNRILPVLLPLWTFLFWPDLKNWNPRLCPSPS